MLWLVGVLVAGHYNERIHLLHAHLARWGHKLNTCTILKYLVWSWVIERDNTLACEFYAMYQWCNLRRSSGSPSRSWNHSWWAGEHQIPPPNMWVRDGDLQLTVAKPCSLEWPASTETRSWVTCTTAACTIWQVAPAVWGKKLVKDQIHELLWLKMPLCARYFGYDYLVSVWSFSCFRQPDWGYFVFLF